MVSDLTLDSRAVSPGRAVPRLPRAARITDCDFAAEAVARGARAVLYERGDARPASLPQLPRGHLRARGADS